MDNKLVSVVIFSRDKHKISLQKSCVDSTGECAMRQKENSLLVDIKLMRLNANYIPTHYKVEVFEVAVEWRRFLYA